MIVSHNFIYYLIIHMPINHYKIKNPMNYSAVVLFFLLAIAFGTVVPRLGPIDSHVPLTYKVNVDDPPLVRWAPIIKDYQH